MILSLVSGRCRQAEQKTLAQLSGARRAVVQLKCVRHRVKSERPIRFELLLAEELIAGRLMRELWVTPLVIQYIAALIIGSR